MGHKLLPKRPVQYHAKKSSKGYFEGWYFKQSSDRATVSIIVGVHKSEFECNDTAFIQLLLSPVKSYFFSYPIKDFYCSKKPFYIKLCQSYFSLEKVLLNINQSDTKVMAEFCYNDIVPLKTHMLSPSIMGPFSYLPKMQCNHAIISLTHRVDGALTINKQKYVFENANGYIEKDWGEAFPSSWVWLQGNTKDVSLMCSIATIPYGKIGFTGLICVLLTNTKQYRFATYNGAKIIELTENKRHVTIVLQRGSYRLSIIVTSEEFGTLTAPTKSGMSRKIMESISSQIDIALYDKENEICRSHLVYCGLEIFGAKNLLKHKTSN